MKSPGKARILHFKAPILFGFSNSILANHVHFFLEKVVPHKKFLCILSIFLCRFFGRSKNCITWLGILLRKDLAKVALTAMLRNLVFQPII